MLTSSQYQQHVSISAKFANLYELFLSVSMSGSSFVKFTWGLTKITDYCLIYTNDSDKGAQVFSLFSVPFMQDDGFKMVSSFSFNLKIHLHLKILITWYYYQVLQTEGHMSNDASVILIMVIVSLLVYCFSPLPLSLFSKIISILFRLSKEPSSSGGLGSASGIIQNFLKEGEVSKLSEDEQCRVCSLLCTAEYCMETTQQLEEKLREKVDAQLRLAVDLSAEQDMFHT